ncbi:unnamed protein product [Nesidiocoris tenuis]|uniref:Uncharacterized protein n=1 Tax=Nesidiocoris tenuis TaxID=355587 RepID=A0A6H5GDQ2_9HEMI|nr:unnamed protein product [Nesidiocoris tenuis]
MFIETYRLHHDPANPPIPAPPPVKNFWKARMAAMTRAILPMNKALMAMRPIAPRASGSKVTNLAPTSIAMGRIFFFSLARPEATLFDEF